MRAGILADDLTGALDTVSPFVACGLAGTVSVAEEAVPAAESCVFAVNTETRDRENAPDRVVARCRKAVDLLKAHRPSLLFKKIDSTLRGRIAGELAVLRGAMPERLPVICPSFPTQGRTVQAGMLTVNGQPWHLSGFAPPGRASAGLTVAAVCGLPGAQIGLGVLRRGAEDLVRTLEAHRRGGTPAVYCDAVLQEDLQILAKALLAAPDHFLPVGAAGLAAALAAETTGRSFPGGRQEPNFPAPNRVLLVIGSRNAGGRRLAMRLAEHIGAVPTVVDPQDGAAQGQPVPERKTLLLAPETTRTEDVAPVLAQAAGETLARAWAQNRPFDALFLSGGHTALEVLRAVQGEWLEVQGQMEPGIARAILRGGPCAGMVVLTGAGGFAAVKTLHLCFGIPVQAPGAEP